MCMKVWIQTLCSVLVIYIYIIPKAYYINAFSFRVVKILYTLWLVFFLQTFNLLQISHSPKSYIVFDSIKNSLFNLNF